MQARMFLQSMQLKKSGHNKFAGYQYFELGDFLPQINEIFHAQGLCGVISYTKDYADLTITDVDDGTFITISSPMVEASTRNKYLKFIEIWTYISRQYKFIDLFQIY